MTPELRAARRYLDLTPWARTAIDADARLALLARIPAGHTLSLAGRNRDYSASLTNADGHVASAHHQPTWQAAADAVLGVEVGL